MKSYRIPELTRKYVEYDMIQTHTELPSMADFRIRLLHMVLDENRALSKFSELYAIVVSLVQLGMDTHDLIDTHLGKRTTREMRSRQLKVLAGDYFSSRFYYLLAQAGQVEMVTKISEAVCEVNRLKVNLYTRMKQLKLSAEDYMNQMVQLKSELFSIFETMLDGPLSRLWPELLHSVSKCELVLEELRRSESPAGFHNSWAYWHVLQEGTEEERERLAGNIQDASYIQGLIGKYDIRNQLTVKLQAAFDGLRSTAKRLEADTIGGELNRMLDGYMKNTALPVTL